jgi:hypothetical protein
MRREVSDMHGSELVFSRLPYEAVSVYSLVMLFHCSQDCSTRNIKDLHITLLVTSNYQLSILPELSRSCSVFKPGYGLDYLSGLRSVYQDSSGGSHRISMWFRGTEVDVSDWRRVLDE